MNPAPAAPAQPTGGAKTAIGGALSVILILGLVGLKVWRASERIMGKTVVDETVTLDADGSYSGSIQVKGNCTYSFDVTAHDKPLKMAPGATEVVVKTVVLQPGGQPIPIDYGMEKTPEGWKVYDITVDGVSLVVNYRSSFAQEIQQGGVEQLIRTLHQKNNNGGLQAKKH